jgi:hypothetical protein
MNHAIDPFCHFCRQEVVVSSIAMSNILCIVGDAQLSTFLTVTSKQSATTCGIMYNNAFSHGEWGDGFFT